MLLESSHQLKPFSSLCCLLPLTRKHKTPLSGLVTPVLNPDLLIPNFHPSSSTPSQELWPHTGDLTSVGLNFLDRDPSLPKLWFMMVLQLSESKSMSHTAVEYIRDRSGPSAGHSILHFTRALNKRSLFKHCKSSNIKDVLKEILPIIKSSNVLFNETVTEILFLILKSRSH